MSTEAKRASNARHQEKLDRIYIQPPKEAGTKIRQAAANAGQSVQGYILEAVRDRIERETSK